MNSLPWDHPDRTQNIYKETPVFICTLGDFRLLKQGQSVLQRGNGSKAGLLLSIIALQSEKKACRSFLLDSIWPRDDTQLAGQSLNSLIHSLRKLLSSAINGESPVLVEGNTYALNVEAGIGVDVAHFDESVDAGERSAQKGDWRNAVQHFHQALAIYRGDLLSDSIVEFMIERERLRGRYLSVLSQLANYSFREGDYSLCLSQSHRMLASDPCREDAHRLIMRCYVRRSERAQALRQFILCRDILKAQFDAQPELDTLALYEQVQLDPSVV